MHPVKNLEKLGYQIINDVYTDQEINQILNYISKNNWNKKFGVRYFLHENKALNDWIFTPNFKNILQKITPNPFVIKSIYFDKRQEITNKMLQSEKVCEVRKGGILLIKPMVLHSSKRSENQLNRRVIHIEFSSKSLAQGVTWLEKQEIFTHYEN